MEDQVKHETIVHMQLKLMKQSVFFSLGGGTGES